MVENIQGFLSSSRIAIVGVSHNPKDFSRILYRAFRDRHYELEPVNPNTREVEGKPCFPRVQDIDPPVEAALLMTSPAVSAAVVKDCAAAGIRRVWLFRRSPAAEEFCRGAGITVVSGECPLMFLPNTGLIHRIHRWFHDRRSHVPISIG